MKIVLLLVLLVAALVGDVVLWRRVQSLEVAVASATAPKDYPLGETMGYLQRYADKLWFAAEAGNWDLAGYYRDELAETAEDMAGAHVVKDGVEVSKTVAQMLPPVLKSVGEAVAAHNSALFRERYQGLIGTCNACHQAAKHPFIHIVVPAGPSTYWNQQFSTP